MKQLLIIPDRKQIEKSLQLSKEYSLGFEYNDFFHPGILDNEKQCAEIIGEYKKNSLPKYCTMHGAFFDVIPFSPDMQIREISLKRIQQSICMAKKIGASAVVFHTNYNPFLNAPEYVENWIKQNADIWGAILEEHSDISIYLENMFDTAPDIMKALSERLAQYVNYGVCLDYAHASLSPTQPHIWAQALGQYVKHIHINDNDLVSDLHLAWGAGKIKRNEFYEMYQKYTPDASILIETTSIENQEKSLAVLKKEGFI